MSTNTKTRSRMDDNGTNGNGGGTQVAILHPPRLPYHPAIEERFGVDRASWKALTEAIYPMAKTTDSVIMALSYCRARKLDPFKKPVHIVPMWSSAKGEYVETVWPGISEIRTTAFRTGQYAGCDETVFGDEVEHTFKGRVKIRGEWHDRSIVLRFPAWARITVYRDLNGVARKFVGPKVRWLEAYATIGNTDLPNEMWETRLEGQLEKCAEAAALRKAFPEEVGNMLSAEEMEGRRVDALTDEQRTAMGAARPTLGAALDELARGGNGNGKPEPEAEVVELHREEPDHEAERLAELENEGREAEGATATPKRPVRIDLELGLRNTTSPREVLAYLQDNAGKIAEMGRDDRRLWDTAVLQHQDSLKKPVKD